MHVISNLGIDFANAIRDGFLTADYEQESE
jgi:hypothetical protein